MARCNTNDFRERAFVGDEAALIRVMGLTVVVIGWLYLFGGRSEARQIVAASVVDRLVFVPAVLVSLVIAGVFPRLLGTFAILRPSARHWGVGDRGLWIWSWSIKVGSPS